MNLHIMGAGAMGCLWAAHLHHCHSFHSISFIDNRSSNKANASRDRLSYRVNSPFLPHIPQGILQEYPVVTSPPGSPIDCLFICTKSYDALPGLNSIKESIGPNTIITLFQNGLGSQYEIIKAFPSNPIYAAVSTEGANRNDNTIIHAGKGITRIGPLTQAAENVSVRAQFLERLQFSTSNEKLVVQYEALIWKALWHKLVINCAINPYTALLDCSNGQVRRSEIFLEDWPKLRKELSTLLVIAGYPLTEEQVEEAVFDVMEKTQDNISSMLQDVRNEKRTEINDINGFAARYLSENREPNHINAKLTRCLTS